VPHGGDLVHFSHEAVESRRGDGAEVANAALATAARDNFTK